MIKIGQITFFKTLYGAILQCAALQYFCRTNKFECELINYSAYGLYRQKKWTKRLLSKCNEFLDHNLVCRKRYLRTIDFSKRNIHMTYKFSSEDELVKADNYDVYIAGSDQIWNPINSNGSSAYFLQFAPKSSMKIAYAPSFGVSSLSFEIQQKYKEYLKTFDFLSARETQGATLIENLTGKKVPVVLDPVFLLSAKEWRDIQSQNYISRRYVICYLVGNNKTLRQMIESSASKIANELDAQIIWIGCPSYMRIKNPFDIGWDIGPGEFINLIDNASYIITNSFHALAFSIIFNKEFLIVLPENEGNKEKSLNSRQLSLLKKLNMLDHLGIQGKENNIIYKTNYKNINIILNSEIEKSQKFLIEAIKLYR